MLEVRYDKAKVAAVQRALREVPKEIPVVMYRALNRTATNARTKLKKVLAQRLGWRQKDIVPYLPIHKASRDKWIASISAPTRKIDAISLRAKGTKHRGVTYKDPVSGQRVRRPHAFIYRMPSRGTQVWERSLHRLGHRKYIDWGGRRMEALFPLKGPSLYDVMMVHARADTDRIMSQSAAVLEKNIQQQVRLILSRRLPA